MNTVSETFRRGACEGGNDQPSRSFPMSFKDVLVIAGGCLFSLFAALAVCFVASLVLTGVTLFGVVIVVSVVILAAGIYAVDTANVLRNRSDMHLWPSVTRCRLCDQRIWAWQRYERRSMKINVDNPCGVWCGVSGSSLCHKTCPGHPTGSVGIRVGVTQ